MIEQNIDEILEAIWEVEEREAATVAAVKKQLAGNPEFDDEALKGLVEKGFVAAPQSVGGEIKFTDAGRAKAGSIIRRRRLAEILVQDVLTDKQRSMAEVGCEFEHMSIPEVEESICILLGHPRESPDGKPIPPGRCCKNRDFMPQKSAINIMELKPGESGKVAFIRPKNHARMHRLMSFGLNPGTTIQVHQKKPALVIQYENTELAIDADVADDIFVWKLPRE